MLVVNRPGAVTQIPQLHKFGVVGGGAWGTALACVAARAGRSVTLWAREPEIVEAVNTDHQNPLFLPGIPLESGIRATGTLTDLAGADALLLVAPAQHLRTTISALAPNLPDGLPLVICAKGMEQDSGKLLSTVLAETAAGAIPAVLSGPSFAADVAKGLPTAVTLACADTALADALIRAIGLPTFRPYASTDVIGAQVGGAIKNVLAIACGIVEGRRLGDSARAALTTRGFAEMTRLGVALGGRQETLAGLSGLGDLILTCNSRQSRNMSLGFALGEGADLDALLGGDNSVKEGVYTASAAVGLASKYGIDMPIATAVDAILTGKSSIEEAIDELLSRPFRSEV